LTGAANVDNMNGTAINQEDRAVNVTFSRLKQDLTKVDTQLLRFLGYIAASGVSWQ
jgi:hypothetical protein